MKALPAFFSINPLFLISLLLFPEAKTPQPHNCTAPPPPPSSSSSSSSSQLQERVMAETSSSSDEELNETAAAMEEINAEDEEINAEDEEINAEDLNGGGDDDNEEDFEPIDIDENEPEEAEADEIVVEKQESLMKFENKASNAAKIVQLLKNLLSVEVKIYSEASKEFVKLLKSDSGGELLYEYVNSSPACAELVKAWEMRKAKRGGEHVLSLIKVVLSHPDGMYKSNDIGRITISRRLDKFAQYIITTKLEDVYAELNSKEEKNQKGVLLLLAAVVRRGVGLASELAKRFNFKLPIFPKLAEYGKKGAYVTRRSFIEFAMSFMEIGNPRLLRWILQQKDMYSGILCGLGSDDDETVVHVLSTLQDRVLTPDSLVPPGLRSVLFGSLTLKQLKNISEDVGPSASIAHEVLIKVCTDPQNGLMPDMNAHTAPLKGNTKRLSDLMKKLNPAYIRCHRDLVLAIVSRDPTFASSYMDEFPFNLEPCTSPIWFDAISLAADVVSSASTSCYFGSLVSRPSVNNSEVQCLLKCIIPRSFSRVIINRGLLHSDALVRHSSLRFLLEGLKSLDRLLDIIDSNCHSNDTMAQKWLSLKQEIQDEAKALLPDPQVLLKLLSSLRHNDSRSCDTKSKRGRKLEGDDEASAKKLKIDLVDKDIDIVIGGISTEPDDTVSSKRGNIDGTEDLKSEKECVKVIAGIWALTEYSMIGDKLKDAEIYFHSKLLDVLTFYLRTMPNALEGSFDFFKMLPSNPFTLSSNQQQSLLSLLIEYTGCSPGIKVSFRPPEVMYKYLPSLINLLIYSPVKGIQDKAYTLARAAMLSSGAFDRNLWEVDAWFLFLPGYRREKLIMESQRTKVFQDLSAVVVSFVCDAVSTVGNNLYKYLDNVRHTVSNLKGLEDFAPDFSPLIICILKKCLRLMDSNSATFKLSEKSMISMYVCNTLCFLLQTQVQGELLASLIDVILTERLGDCSFEDDDNSGKFLCEWRPLKNLLLFSRNLSHQQAFNSLHSITQKTLTASTHPFSRTLGKVKKTVKRECQGDLVGLATAFCSSVICTTPDEILENFPSVITISQYLLGEHLSFLASVFFLERNLLADVADRWPDIFFSGLDLVEAPGPSNQKLDACFLNKTNSSEELLESTSGAFSFFLKKAPFLMLFPSIIGTGVSDSLVSDKLLHILKVKLYEGSPADCVASLRLLLFWIHQIQLSYKVKPLNELEQLSQTCFILINHILAKLLVVTSDSDSSTSIEAPVLVPFIQEAVKIIFHHPAVAISLSQPLCCNTELNYESLGDSFEDFICSSKSSIHPMDHNILHLVTSVSDYLFCLANDQCAVSDDHDSAKKPLVKVFKTLVQRVILIFKDKFGLCIESRDMMPLLPTYHIFHAISRFMSPFELLELVNWMFGEVDRADSKDWKSSKVSAFSIGCRIAASGFDLMSSWEVKGESFDPAFLEKVYYKVIELATVFKLESADLCLLKAVKFVYKHKRMQPKSAVFPLLAVSRVVVSSPIETIIHCIQKTTATKAKLLFLLTEVSPLHLTLFGQIFSCILDRDCPFKSNMIEEICNHALSDENHMMLLPVASSFLDWSITKFGVQYLKTCDRIPSFYSRMLLDGFRNWKSYLSSNIFQGKHGESVPTSTEDLLNLFSGSLLGKAVHMLRYYFALNEDSMGMEKRMKLFDSIYPCVGADDELLDYDVGEINISATNHSLDILNRVVAKITFSRLLLFPKDNFIQFQLTETGEHLKEVPWGMGSNREDSPKLRFMSILVSTLHAIIRRFPLVSDNSAKSKSTDNTSLFRLLEVFILRNITELSREMQSDLIQLQSLPFLEQFIRSSLQYRFEDPTTLRVLCDVLMSLSEGKFSCHVIFEMLLAHSQFIPTILWNDSISESSRVSDAGTLFKPISSILNSHVLLFDINETGEKASLQLSPLYGRKLEVIKLLRVLYHLKAHQKAVAPREDVSMNSTELLSLLLSCYGATMGDIDLEIYNLMNEIVSTEGADCLGIAEMDYMWGSAALKLRKEKMLEKVLSSNHITDCGTPEERRRKQFRESFAVDPKLCLATVLHFPYDRIACDGPTPLTKLPRDNLMHKLEAPSGKTGRIQQYDPAFILRFSIHGLSKGYLEHLEFAGLGLLAIAIMSISSPDEGIRKLGYEALGRFKNAMENSQNRKGGLRLRLLLTYLQNGIAEPWQRIPSVIAIFVAESSVVLLDPSHDHYLTISKLLLRSPRVDLKSIPLFHTLFRSSSVNFKTDRLWILRLSYAGINLDDDAQIFMRKSLLEMLLGYYSSSLSDYESKILILQIMKKSVKLPKLALYLVEHCGLISWLSSVLCFCGERLCDDHTNLFVKQMMIGIEVVNGVISQRRVTDFLQKHALEQLSELSSHLYRILVGSSKMIKQNVALVNLILQLLVTTLRISQKRKEFQPHFNLSYEGLFRLYKVIDEEPCNTRSVISADLVLRALLMSSPPAVISPMDREKLQSLVVWGTSIASMSDSEEMLKESDIHFTTFSGEQQCKETLISILLRWVTASVILGNISRKSCKINTLSSSERANIKTLQSLLENIKKDDDAGIENYYDEGRKQYHSNDTALAATILYLQQILGMNRKMLQSVVSSLCLLLLSHDSSSTGVVSLIGGDQVGLVASLCSKISCPLEANPAWRWSFDQPWKDVSLEPTDLQVVDEYQACETLLVIFSNALGGNNSLDLPVLSHRNLEESGVFAWERDILTTQLSFK